MDKISITFDLKYVDSKLSQAESHPQIACYLDSSFQRYPTIVHLKKVGEVHRVNVVGLCPHGVTPNSDSALCFAHMAWRSNNAGNPCLLDTGTSHITFDEITRNIGTGSFSKNVDMIMHTANNVNKGTFCITIHKQDFDAKSYKTSVGDRVDNTNTIKNHLMNYTETVMRIEENIPEYIKGTERMRMPFDYSESGFQSTNGTPLPAFAYVMSEAPNSNTNYWVNAFNNIMRRDGLKPEEWNILSIKGQARASVLTCCYLSHYLDYVSDTVDTNNKSSLYSNSKVFPYENFGDAGFMISGDCEDLGSLILQCCNSFLGHTFPSGSKYDTFRSMQTILKQYVPPLSLDTVNGAQVSDQVQQLGAHMNDNFIPAKTFRTWLENTREGLHISESLPWEKDTLDEDLPFLVGEGTGMYEPLGFDYPLLPLMQYVYQAPSLQSFKKPILHKNGQAGSFFLGSLVGLTDYFYRRGYNTPTGFLYCTKVGNQLKRGVLYEDMMNNNNDKIAIKLHPEPSKQVMNIVNVAISRRIPPRPLFLKENPNHPSTNSHLDKICNTINNLGRPSGISTNYVPLYVREHQLNNNITQRIINDFKSLNRVWKVDYYLESITDEIWGYRVKIFVN